MSKKSKKCNEPQIRDIGNITWNNYSEDDYSLLKAWCQKECTWWILGQEIASSGTPHIQGAFYMKNRGKTISLIRKMWPKAHIEKKIPNSTWEQVRRYCTGIDKDGNNKSGRDDIIYEEDGDLPQQGTRSDLKEGVALIKSGMSIDELVLSEGGADMYHVYGRTLERVERAQLALARRTTQTKGIWYWGPTGCGKTFLMEQGKDDKDIYDWIADGDFWEGYRHQKYCLVDEYRGEGNDLSFAMLLRIADKSRLRLKRKGGGGYYFTSQEVIITSPLHPKDIFTNLRSGDDIAQLLRRYEVIYVPPRDGGESSSGQPEVNQKWSGNTRLTTMKPTASSISECLKCENLFCDCL